ncbi:membrane protein [Pilimelia anulata]|uniref:Membrane protein n=1 Tax=Pilimelia anulata TaxID=53371 RepID=A0A8J3F8S4_9ACTN|nr:DUF456 domain-containing protein [Pilimelia anulata]GGJ80716.1 membrane protein [Pilimelia anulata]
MDHTDLVVTIVAGLIIAVGALGVVVPVLPGLALCWGGVLLWALVAGEGWQRWAVLGLATVLALAATVIKFLWPGKRLQDVGVPNRTLLCGAALGVVGFFVIPVIGLALGFVLGVWLAEWARLGDHARAWPSTKEALLAAGISMLVEFAAAVAIGLAWLLGVISTL